MSPDSDKYFGSVLQQNLAIKILLKMRIRQRNGDANGVRMWPRQLVHQTTMNTKRRSTTTRARRTTMTTSSHSGANNMMVAMAAAYI